MLIYKATKKCTLAYGLVCRVLAQIIIGSNTDQVRISYCLKLRLCYRVISIIIIIIIIIIIVVTSGVPQGSVLGHFLLNS
jgi:hypothetical protein